MFVSAQSKSLMLRDVSDFPNGRRECDTEEAGTTPTTRGGDTEPRVSTISASCEWATGLWTILVTHPQPLFLRQYQSFLMTFDHSFALLSTPTSFLLTTVLSIAMRITPLLLFVIVTSLSAPAFAQMSDHQLTDSYARQDFLREQVMSPLFQTSLACP